MARARKFAETRNAKTGEVLMQHFCPAAGNDALSVALRILTHQLTLRTPEPGHGGGIFGGEFGYGLKFENETFLTMPDYCDVECNFGHCADASLWFDQHPHAQDCYSRKLYDGRLDRPDLDAESEAALKERNRHKWNSRGEKAAQKRVSAAYAAERRHQTRVTRGLCKEHGIPWNGGKASMVHCTCERDALSTAWLAEHRHAERCPVAIPNFWHFATGLKVRWYKYIGRDMKVEPGTATDVRAVLSDCLGSLGAPAIDEAVDAYAAAEKEAAEASKRAAEFWTSAAGRTAMSEMEAQGIIKTITFRP